MTEYVCGHCGSTFKGKPSDPGRHCSRACAASARTDERNSNWRGGKHSHPLYGVYSEMVARCTRTSHPRWDDYGGRGITVCERWREDFWNFIADMGPRPEGVGPTGRSLWSVERMDNDGPYSPDNCRWATNFTQRHNRRDSRPRRKAIA